MCNAKAKCNASQHIATQHFVATHTKKINHFLQLLISFFATFNNMARLSSLPNTTLQSNLPIKNRLALALQFLRENSDEKPATAARLYKIEKERTVRQA